MKMRENIQEIFKALSSDETLLRLLFYKPLNALDNPLDTSKQNILDKKNKWDIINDVIKASEDVTNLDTTPKCRLLIFPGNRDATGNYLVAEQDFVFDVLVHASTFDTVDQRLSWICDYLNSIISNSRITGIGKIQFKRGLIINAPNGYSGYRLIYQYGSGSR